VGKELARTDSGAGRKAYTYSLKHSFGIPENDRDALVAVATGNTIRIFAESSKKDLAATLRKSIAKDNDGLLRAWCIRNARKDSLEHSLDLLRTIRKVMVSSRHAELVETDLVETDKFYEYGEFLNLMERICCSVRKGCKNLNVEKLVAFQLLEHSMEVLGNSLRERAMMDIISSGVKIVCDEVPFLLLGAYHLFNLNKRLHDIGLDTVEMNGQMGGALRYGLLVKEDARAVVKSFIPTKFMAGFLDECSGMAFSGRKGGSRTRTVERKVDDFVEFLLGRKKLTGKMYYAVLNLSAVATFETLLASESGTPRELKEEQTIKAYTRLGALYDKDGRISANDYRRVLSCMLRRLGGGCAGSGDVVEGYAEGLRALA
jgi:hypothetical protein